MKKSYDFRGRQSNIFRLAEFEPFGFIHTFSYRILLLIDWTYGILILASLFNPSLGIFVKSATIIIWILITPQLFAAMKGIVLASTHGAVFSKFSVAYSYLISKKSRPIYNLYKIFPYFVVAVWLILFFVMLSWWPI